MDGVTQQNSALVEENAATAKTLEHQAQAMDEQVSFFKVEERANGEPAEAAPRQPVQKRNAAPNNIRSRAAA